MAAILSGSSFKRLELEPVVKNCYVVMNQNTNTFYAAENKDSGRIFIFKAQRGEIKLSFMKIISELCIYTSNSYIYFLTLPEINILVLSLLIYYNKHYLLCINPE